MLPIRGRLMPPLYIHALTTTFGHTWQRLPNGFTRWYYNHSYNYAKPRYQMALAHDGDQEVVSGAADGLRPFIFNIAVGTSLQTLSVVMDITSDRVWVQCERCTSCTTKEGTRR